jgi:hypothetical protein
MADRDNRRWIKVYPRDFSNEYFFVGFDNKEEKNNFMNKVNDEPNSSAYVCRKSKVEKVDEFEEIKNYRGLNGVYTLWGSDIDILRFLNEYNIPKYID